MYLIYIRNNLSVNIYRRVFSPKCPTPTEVLIQIMMVKKTEEKEEVAKKMVLLFLPPITTKLSKILPVFMSLAAETLGGLWRGDLPSPDTGSPSRPEMAELGTGEMRCQLGMVLWMGNMKYDVLILNTKTKF